MLQKQMKLNFHKALIILSLHFFLLPAFGQSPASMSYQAVIRNSSNHIVVNQTVGVQISILQGSTSGTEVYVETQTTTTNANGLVSIEIGTGTTNDDFSVIDWANGPYFIKTETDPLGGTNYTITGTSQLLSVPYAFYAKEAETITGGLPAEEDPLYTAWDKDYNDLINTPVIPTVPTNVSDLTNDVGYLTNYTETDPLYSAWDKDYNDLINTPTIPTVPTNVSDFINDAGYITNEVQILSISNDTLFLTGGSFVKLPVGFDGQWSSLSGTAPNISAFPNDEGYLKTFNEADPLFQTSIASGITGADTTNWNSKQDKLVAGSNISIAGNTISSTSGAGFNHYIGELYGGGIVVAVWKENGVEHGLIASLTDVSTSAQYSSITSVLIGPAAQSPTDGQANTNAILAQGDVSGAAYICANYSSGVYNDWYLPSTLELKLCYDAAFIVNLILGPVNGFQIANYWSSTEYYNTNSWHHNFFRGTTDFNGKANTFRVRAVRRF